MNRRHQELREIYERQLNQLSDLLYEHDPYGMGLSASAPSDEYRPIAEKLMPILNRANSLRDYQDALNDKGITDLELVNHIWRIFNETLEA